MTLGDIYGSRPDLLPRSSVRVARMPEGGIGWVGREGIEFLDLGQHRVAESVLDRFPRGSDGTIEWDTVTDGAVVESMKAAEEDLIAVLNEIALTCESLVFIWDSLAVPSVRASRSAANRLAIEAVDTFAEFWIVCEPSGSLIEFSSFKDRLAHARLSM